MNIQTNRGLSLNLAALKQIIRFSPNEPQKTILKNMERFTVVVSGKRLGKSTMCAYLALKELFLPYHVTWIIGPNYEVASRVWDYIVEWIEKYFEGDKGPFSINRHIKVIENKTTKSRVFMKSGEETSSLLGKGLNLAIIDEASRIANGVWDGYIRPNLADGGQGRAVLISNPFGYNWFYDLYLRGSAEGRIENPDYISFQFPTALQDEYGNIIGSNNPRAISVQELKSIKLSTPRDKWLSEYMGVFREGAGQLFRGIDDCIDNTIPIPDPEDWFTSPISSHLYSLGVDIGKSEDFTVICIVDRMNHRLVGFWKSNGTSWEIVREKIKELSHKYNDAEITLDTTGMGGDMFVESLADMSVNVNTEYKYTGRTKMLLMDKLSILLERKQIIFPRIPSLINELKSFTYKKTDSGHIKYGSSKKDDAVNALALACWNLNEEPLEDTLFGNIYGMRQRRYY